jgi:hypothetical protein
MKAFVVEEVLLRTGDYSESIMEDLENELSWIQVTHHGGEIPRQIAIQCSLNEKGDRPLYRHPMDQFPEPTGFTNTVEKIKKSVEDTINKGMGTNHVFNHVIIQKYRDGKDYIEEHSDKTLDIEDSSVIANYSLGTTRVLKFRSKDPVDENIDPKKYNIYNLDLNNDSVCVTDLDTNRLYRHSIRKNSEIESPRISLTFRTIGTFYDKETLVPYGKGAPKEDTEGLSKDELIQAWSLENNSSGTSHVDLYKRGYSGLY